MTLPRGDPESELLSLLSGRPEEVPSSYSSHHRPHHHHSTTALNSDRATDLRRAHHAPRNRTVSLNVALEKSTMMVMKDRQEEEERVEGGWGWVVVAASLACLCLLDGVSYSFGVLLTPLMAELQAGRVGVAAAGSLQTGIYALAGLCVAKLVTR
jgi:hypothetical protein